MRKWIAFFLCVFFLFHSVSCSYDGYQTVPGNALAELVGDVQIPNSLESEKPLQPYTVYEGNEDIISDEEAFRPFYQQGICKDFNGDTLVVLLFMDDEESAWTKKEVEDFTSKNVMPALGFLKREASRWGVELRFQVESYSSATTGYTLSYPGALPTRVTEDEKRDALTQASLDFGFDSEWTFYSYMQSQYPSQEIIFITIFNKRGRAYTMQYARKKSNRNVEYCVIFAQPKPAMVIAHEIPHLFGAEDLYAENSTEETEKIAKDKYPCDIMHTYLSLEENCIDAYTAYAMGWIDEIPDVCYMDGWSID